jgi:hypothetical protein
MPDLKRPLDHLDRSLGRQGRKAKNSGMTAHAVDELVSLCRTAFQHVSFRLGQIVDSRRGMQSVSAAACSALDVELL